MLLLLIGLVLFFGVHVALKTPLKASITESVGENGRKGIVALVSLAGFLLIIFGFRAADYVHLWQPLPGARHLASLVVLIAVILLIAGNVPQPSNIKKLARHPMSLAVALWGGVHLLANGDLASALIFASFTAYAVLDMRTAKAAIASDATIPSLQPDIIIAGSGLVVFLGLFYSHAWLAGVPLN